MRATTPAVAYYRMSDDKQAESIGDQRKAVEEYAKQKGYKIIREYADEGISGWKSEKRLAFQSLINDADSGEFEAVLCWDQDRFSRFPVLEANHYWYLLDRAGVHISTVSQGRLNFSDLGEWLKASVVQHGKAEYCRDLSRNVCRGMREKRHAGFWFGRAPYGYVVKDGKLALGNPEHIAIVQRIFKLRLAGYGTHLVAVELNNDGIKTGLGKTWKSQSIRCIIERTAYIGDSEIGRYSTGKFNQLTPEPVIVRDTHPTIIDRETFEEANALPKISQAANGRGGGNGAKLSGLITCGLCGGPMYSLTQRNNSFLYRCANYSEGSRRKGRKCGHCAVDRGQIERAVFTKLREKLLLNDRDRLEAAIERELEHRAGYNQAIDEVGINKQIGKLGSQIEKATGQILLIDEDLLPAAQTKLREMKQKKEQLQSMLIKPSESSLPSANEIANELWAIDELLRTAEPVAVRHILRTMISGIVCNFQHDKANSTPKRKRYRFAGGEIVLPSSELAKEGR